MSDKRIRHYRKFPDDEGYLNEKIISYRQNRSWYVAQLTKTINNVSDLIISKGSFEDVIKYNDKLEKIVLLYIRHETDDKIIEKEINTGTEQEFKLI